MRHKYGINCASFFSRVWIFGTIDFQAQIIFSIDIFSFNIRFYWSISWMIVLLLAFMKSIIVIYGHILVLLALILHCISYSPAHWFHSRKMFSSLDFPSVYTDKILFFPCTTWQHTENRLLNHKSNANVRAHRDVQPSARSLQRHAELLLLEKMCREKKKYE